MEDLCKVGRSAVKNINNLKASDVGDLVISIGEIIEQLRNEPESYKERLDYLEGMFREFAYGEKYERPEPPKQEEDDSWGLPPGIGALSGVISTPPLSVSINSSPPFTLPYVIQNPCGEQPLNDTNSSEDDEYEEDEVKQESRKFVKRWWNKQTL